MGRSAMAGTPLRKSPPEEAAPRKPRPWELHVVWEGWWDKLGDGPTDADFRLGRTPMRWANAERSVLRINDQVVVTGIPKAAHDYVVNGRTPLEWLIGQYRWRRDRRSRIVNDPNDAFDDPWDLIVHIHWTVHVSVESARIISELPDPFDGAMGTQMIPLTSD